MKFAGPHPVKCRCAVFRNQGRKVIIDDHVPTGPACRQAGLKSGKGIAGLPEKVTGGAHLGQPGFKYRELSKLAQVSKMRDMVHKNLVSGDHKRRVLLSSEVVDNQGVRSIIHRHLICIVREVKGDSIEKPQPYLYVLKERNEKEHREKFFCRMKGSLYIAKDKRTFLVLFTHSLKITLVPTPQDSMKYN